MQRAARKTRLGWLGPALVILGAAVAGVAIWFMQTARPVPGEVIDTIPISPTSSIVVRKEATSDRSFIEVRDGDTVRWQALIPTYAGSKGRRAVAWSDQAVTVRVVRDGRAEVFAFAMNDAHKLGAFRIASDHEPITLHEEGPITLTDNVRSYELVGGDSWHQIAAVDIRRGGGVWKAELGKDPITDGGVEPGRVWVEQAGRRRYFDAETGRETPDTKPLN